MFDKIQYGDLKAKQQENYNFAKVAAILADYGYTCLRLSDDWQGADFLAYHKDGLITLKVQLKGRLQIDAKYVGKSIFIAFPHGGHWYLYPHDEVIEYFLANGRGGFFSTGTISAKHQKFMEQYKIT